MPAARRGLGIVARLQHPVAGEEQPGGGRGRRRVEAEDDHAPRTSISRRVAARVGQRDVARDAPAGQLRDRLRALGPLDERDRVGPEVRVEQPGILVGEAGEPVEVQMRDRAAGAVVEQPDDERRARDRPGHAERAAARRARTWSCRPPARPRRARRRPAAGPAASAAPARSVAPGESVRLAAGTAAASPQDEPAAQHQGADRRDEPRGRAGARAARRRRPPCPRRRPAPARRRAPRRPARASAPARAPPWAPASARGRAPPRRRRSRTGPGTARRRATAPRRRREPRRTAARRARAREVRGTTSSAAVHPRLRYGPRRYGHCTSSC